MSSGLRTNTRSGRFANLRPEKPRGGYYTCDDLAAWLCRWAIRSAHDRVLEPGCGDGAFLRAATLRYRELGVAGASIAGQLTGVEISGREARRARAALRSLLGAHAERVVQISDFFGWSQQATRASFDAVVGNPPFIRYQAFPEVPRRRAMALMTVQGLAPNRLTNIWVPFVVAATTALRSGGRLALVLPAELLQVSYAAQLRGYLSERFRRLDMVTCNELLFANAEQEVVLLLADGARPAGRARSSCRVTLTEGSTLRRIIARSPAALLRKARPKRIRHESEKWLKYFLSPRQISFMRTLRASQAATPLSTHAGVDVGVVTGRNEFFVLTDRQVSELGLDGHTVRLVSRSMHLRGARVSSADWQAMAAGGDRVHLLHLRPLSGTRLPAALARYIRQGENNNMHTGYKCSVRDPWYEVPSVWAPDGFLFRQIHDFPRVVLNQAGATSTDTIHRLTARAADPERLIANTYTWLTAASAEIEGRSYGGGVLELEPTEAERLLLPATPNGALPLSECDRLTRSGRLDVVLEENARTVLRGHMGLSHPECRLLRNIWTTMRERRMARGRPDRTSGPGRAEPL